MDSLPEWIGRLADLSIDPARVRSALTGLLKAWPVQAPSLEETIHSFPADPAGLIHLLAISPVSAEKLVRDPDALLWLARPEVCNSDRGPGRMRHDFDRLRSATSDKFDPGFADLRKAKAREALRIALRDVAGMASLEETTSELTVLAEVCLREVYAGWSGELQRRLGAPSTEFVVLGMGKLGGRELNYSSDIDVIFLYEEEGTVKGRLTNHEYFLRLAEKIVGTFAGSHPAGPLFRIDLRLRPEGNSGPLVRSLASMESYYAGFGETWERMALIKARGVAGSEALAYEFSQRLQPFIFPRSVSTDLLEEVSAIKHRIERDIVGAERLTRDVKLGRGGIREIEFVVQTLQLLHGSRHAFLQGNNTLKTLEGLSELDLLPEEESRALSEAYRFLRRVEHRLQIEQEAQTHTVPEGDIGPLALSLGFDGAASFLEELTRQTSAVRRVFDRVLRSSPAPPVAESPKPVCFSDGIGAEKTLARLREGSSGSVHVSPRTKRLFGRLEPLLLKGLGDVADPDAALNRFAGFVERYGIRGLLFETLVVNPRLLELLLRLFDSSPFFTEIVLRRPQLIEEILRGGLLDRRMTVPEYLEGLAKNDEQIEWPDWVRVYRRSQILRIFLRDVLKLADIEDVHAEYTALADACVQFVHRALGFEERFTVVGLGKFGGEEASYGCDLDVLFVGGQPEDAAVLIKSMTAITSEGLVFPVDARLRPEGNAGLLTLPLEGYRQYFERRAQVWEAQSLTKARSICGPEGKGFMEFAREAWRTFGRRPDLLEQISAMHSRVVKERGGGSDLLNFKTGRGGLMALEFMLQGLQMKHDIWENNTLRAITGLCESRVLDESSAQDARESYLFLRRLEAVIRRVSNAGGSSLPREEAEQAKVAVRLGFENRSSFVEAYEGVRKTVNQLFCTVMPVAD